LAIPIGLAVALKQLAASPAFQEVPDILHTIEKQKQPADDGRRL
jgi:hypothetical protein